MNRDLRRIKTYLFFCFSIIFSFLDNCLCQKPAIIYGEKYNIRMGLGGSFDGTGPQKITWFLDELCRDTFDVVLPSIVLTPTDLMKVHSAEYLTSLESSARVAIIAGSPPLADVDSKVLRESLLEPIKASVGGTILACRQALARGLAINLGGGYHCAFTGYGRYFDFFADVPLAVVSLWRENPACKILIVDLDARRGLGLATIFDEEFKKEHSRVALFDMYNRGLPSGSVVMHPTTHYWQLDSGVSGSAYLTILRNFFLDSFAAFIPNLIVYIAGSNVVDGHPVGKCALSPEAIVARDLFIVQAAEERKVPLVILYPSVYDARCLNVIKDSLQAILNYKAVAATVAGESNGVDVVDDESSGWCCAPKCKGGSKKK